MNRYRLSIFLIIIGLGLLISHDVEARNKVIGTRALKARNAELEHENELLRKQNRIYKETIAMYKETIAMYEDALKEPDPCSDAVSDIQGESIGSFGKSIGNMDQVSAVFNAQLEAQVALIAKFTEKVQTTIAEYGKVVGSVDYLHIVVEQAMGPNIQSSVVCRSIAESDAGYTGYVALSAPIKPVHDWLLGLVEEQHRDIFGKIFNDAFQTK